MKKFSICSFIVVFVTFVTTLFVSSQVMAAYIEKVKGKKALIFLDGMGVEKGDLVYSVDASNGKKTAILRITTVKDQKAVGELVKGQFRVDQSIIARKTKAGSKGVVAQEEAPPRRAKNSPFAIGGIFGIDFDSMNTTNPDAKLSGNGFMVGGVLDYNINSWFALRGILGYEQFSAKGTDSTSVARKTTINYVSSMLWGKVNFIQKETRAWAGVGLGIWFPASKSTNILSADSIATTAAYALGGGVDMAFSDTLYIPIQLEYGFLPKSNEVTTGYYSVRAGLMLKY